MTCLRFLFAPVFLASILSASADLRITEFMADNSAGVLPGVDQKWDWIEIHNSSEEDVALEGYYLTDDAGNLAKWKFPAVSLGPNSFGIVFASGENGEPVNSAVSFVAYSDLKLDLKGEYLALVKPDGKTVLHAFEPKYPEQRSGVSYGLANAGRSKINWAEATPGFLRKPTPMSANTDVVTGFAGPVFASQTRGYYREPFDVSLSTTTPEGIIRYTTDGSEPSEKNGQLYEKPIRVERSSTLRAAAFRVGWKESPVLTQSYFFVADIVKQSPKGEPPPEWKLRRGNRGQAFFRNGRMQVEEVPEESSENGQFWIASQLMDFGMDPEIVGKKYPVAQVEQSILALPAISIVTDPAHLFDPSRGIYVNAQQRGVNWERPVSLEMIYPNGQRGFQIDAGLRIRGGFSRNGNNAKHALRVLFKKKYGQGKLKYPLFGEEGPKEFDKVDLTSSLNYSWAESGGNQDAIIRDVFCRDCQRDMGQPYSRSVFYQLYLNGQYWGIYMTQERVSDDYGASHFGGEPEDYDVVKTFGKSSAGNLEAHNRFHEVAQAGFEDDAAYFRVQGLNPDGKPNPEFEKMLDVDNLIDYMILTYYSGNRDGPGGRFTGSPNNFYALYNRKKPDGWKFFAHDMEHALDTGETDMTDPVGLSDNSNDFNCHALHDRLAVNAHYRKRFQERVDKHMFGDGAMTYEKCLARLNSRAQEIDGAIIAYAARWGDAKANPSRTKEDWLNCVQGIREWMEDRHSIVLSQMISRRLYEGIESPPVLKTANGKSYLLQEEGAEGLSLYYTTDHGDPRGNDGQPTATAKQAKAPKVAREVLMPETAKYRYWIPTHGNDDDKWWKPEFDDSAWAEGEGGIGYDDDGLTRPLLAQDIAAEFKNKSNTLYLRYAFDLDALEEADLTQLLIRVDDGFVAYLNGLKIAELNSPPQLSWQSASPSKIMENDGAPKKAFMLDGEALRAFRKGRNVLAIQGLNVSFRSSDFIILPSIESTLIKGGTPVPSGAVVRALLNGKWSPPMTIK